MKRFFAALTLLAPLWFAAPAAAVDPPPYAFHNYSALAAHELDILVVEEDDSYFGKVDMYLAR